MRISYYPGCSLEASASDYSASIRAVLADLDVDPVELPDWSCCGATSAHSIDRQAAIELPARNLAIAETAGMDLVTPCPLCFNRLKSAAKALSAAQNTDEAVQPTGPPIQIFDLADFLAREKMLEIIESRVIWPLSGLQAVAYYGCQASRPPRITDATNCENPMSMDNILQKLGVWPIQWSFKTDCCGASHSLHQQDVAFAMIERLYRSAAEAGARCFVVSCQMCQLNLDAYQRQINRRFGTAYDLPVLYFTELIGLAMGNRAAFKWFSRHFVDPLPMLAETQSVSEARFNPFEGPDHLRHRRRRR